MKWIYVEAMRPDGGSLLARVDLAAASDRVRLVRRGITLARPAGMPVVARPRYT